MRDQFNKLKEFGSTLVLYAKYDYKGTQYYDYKGTQYNEDRKMHVVQWSD
jgi:hypothetical protein